MLKTILVLLRGTKGDGATLTTALAVARPLSCHMECVHIRPTMEAIVASLPISDIEDPNIIQESIDASKQQSEDAVARAADAFARFCAKEAIAKAEFPPGPLGVSAAFKECFGTELDEIISQSRYHDLVVVKGGGEKAGGLSTGQVGRLIMSAGRPVLRAPDIAAGAIRTAVIAWKKTPEAARALTAAMPILETARNLFVIHADEDHDAPADGERVVRMLEWHRLNAESHRTDPGDRAPADAVLEMARAADADLLVMGAYGRSRLRELVLGGFTEGVLEAASIPVLFFH